MTDIVERIHNLRERGFLNDPTAIADEAADEIERLRAEREHAVAVQRNASIALEEKRDEIERLRAALIKIRYLEASDADTWIWQAQEEARAALEPKP